jgi:alpha-amylase/alpha-mannosidase (GH57 family)
MERYICIHGHFYQPPRENAWLEEVEVQHSAYPYHDWNERITAECYATNAASRILDNEKRITQIVNNYAKISYDFGPTLLSWMKANALQVYDAVLQSDKENQKLFSGHGSAMAQAYNHMILPLANSQDKYTQVTWGIKDFQHRFGRLPEGMWLPETAVDLETLEILAESGVKFTVLAPHQAKQVRKIGDKDWNDVSGAKIDPTMAYAINLPSGHKFNLFFYDGAISRAVAFEGLLNSGENFAHRLTGGFSDQRQWPQLLHIATDGESYGHHHPFGDMALAYALYYIEQNQLARVTNYGEFLEKHPPTHEVEIFENTSWSCAHGVERWRSDCGCNTGSHPGWNQGWRGPLRQALDWLRDDLVGKYEKKAAQFFSDPWAARNDYIGIILDRSPDSIRAFMKQHQSHELGKTDSITAIKLLELQRNAMLMYTSCGWFFDDISGIETVQIIQYAGRVVQLAGELFENSIEQRFLKLLQAAKSNLPEQGDGRRIYERYVKPLVVDLNRVAAHYAVDSLFEKQEGAVKIYCYDIDLKDSQQADCGKSRFVAGKVKVTSEITLESDLLTFGALHFGDHNVNAGVRSFRSDDAYREMTLETTQTCQIGDFSQLIRLIDKHFGISTYSLNSLFRDERHKVMSNILNSTLAEMMSAYRQIYDSHYPLMRFLVELGEPLPRAFQAVAEVILNADLRQALADDVLNEDTVKKILNDSRLWGINLEANGLELAFRRALDQKMADFSAKPEDLDLLKGMVAAILLARLLPFTVNLWQVQNIYYRMMKAVYPAFRERAQKDQAAGEWVTQFTLLGEKLSILVT